MWAVMTVGAPEKRLEVQQWGMVISLAVSMRSHSSWPCRRTGKSTYNHLARRWVVERPR